MRTLAVFIVLIGFVCSAMGQTATLSGTITDADTKEPLFGVNIILTGTNLGASADFDGTYTITGIPPGEYNVQFSFIGYEKTLFTQQKISAGEKKKLDVALKSTILTLDDAVVVVGAKPLVDVEEAKTGSTLTSKEIDLQPVR
ncbi:MAG TPA: carboxypeptidase-like regulatory domain-containing protein, partial [Chitinophagales bacterium]|nr:carboxypeptidase-like regulatory domain-containing protein [Chitinophagales bacterium]